MDFHQTHTKVVLVEVCLESSRGPILQRHSSLLAAAAVLLLEAPPVMAAAAVDLLVQEMQPLMPTALVAVELLLQEVLQQLLRHFVL